MKNFGLPDSFDRYSSGLLKPTNADHLAFQTAKVEAAQIPDEQRSRLHFIFDRSLTGEELAEALKLSLIQHDIKPEDVMIRFFSKNRLLSVTQTGSDRDNRSNVCYHGSYDGESEWMRILGIFGNAQVTYVSSLGNRLTGGADAPKVHDLCYVIYDKRFLYKVGHASNGFHAFLTVPNRAVIGFMSDNGTVPLTKPDRTSYQQTQIASSIEDKPLQNG